MFNRSCSLSIEIQHIFVPKMWIKFQCGAQSQDFKLPPSLVAVKAFQQTAGPSSRRGGGCLILHWERERKMKVSGGNNREDGDKLHTPKSSFALCGWVCVCQEECVFSELHLHYYTHMKAIFYPTAQPAWWWIIADYFCSTLLSEVCILSNPLLFDPSSNLRPHSQHNLRLKSTQNSAEKRMKHTLLQP